MGQGKQAVDEVDRVDRVDAAFAKRLAGKDFIVDWKYGRLRASGQFPQGHLEALTGTWRERMEDERCGQSAAGASDWGCICSHHHEKRGAITVQ
jgi:hypothetical protein